MNHAGELAAAVGALLTVVLVVAVMMLIICGVAWALASAHGNYHAAVRARTGVWVSVGAAALAGAGMAWINFLIDVGRAL